MSQPSGESDSGEESDAGEKSDTGDESDGDVDTEKRAELVEVDITGEPGAYTFSVTIESPDTGCEQYADWWEVVTEDGELVYRRILAHSHVNEQPFTRSGGPVDIADEDNVIVRVHMNNTGYSPLAAWISPGGALELLELGDDFAADIENVEPQPDTCAF